MEAEDDVRSEGIGAAAQCPDCGCNLAVSWAWCPRCGDGKWVGPPTEGGKAEPTGRPSSSSAMTRAVIVEVYEGPDGTSLCLSDQNGEGYRLAGAAMDGTAERTCRWRLDADQLVEMVRATEFETEE